MRVVAIVLSLFLFAGCVTEETKQLAWQIHTYQVKQDVVVKKLLREVGTTDVESQMIVKDSEALVTATDTLSTILGRPKK